MKDADRVYLGQAVYSDTVLSMYDFFVLGITNFFIWKCSSSEILSLYNDNISLNHLDVGVGTGYFLDKCYFKTKPRIALMDLNPNCLNKAKKRIQRYAPETYQQNILEKPSAAIDKFDSIALNYLLHCVPGNLREKSVIFQNLLTLGTPNVKIFGSTILADGLPKSMTASYLMKTYNKKGIFNNSQDTLDDLEKTLAENLKKYQIKTLGCVALFSGTP